MNICKVSAIFSEFRLKEVEEALIEHGVNGFTLHPVRGRGRYFDSFNENHLLKHIQVEVYVREHKAGDIVRCIIEAAHVNTVSEGLVSILPVHELFWIHEKRRAVDEDFQLQKRDAS